MIIPLGGLDLASLQTLQLKTISLGTSQSLVLSCLPTNFVFILSAAETPEEKSGTLSRCSTLWLDSCQFERAFAAFRRRRESHLVRLYAPPSCAPFFVSTCFSAACVAPTVLATAGSETNFKLFFFVSGGSRPLSFFP
eukprot:TRINITY_DN6154_c0_g1_i2.p1 TRINITY_DN6154_c0_g1~~TRINITY_DN6154_c0_g1_i2.p1  ORF type:complete len:138 (-),score=15.38 TRINITY_DN6154_c0_g1_i2:441-854(-)